MLRGTSSVLRIAGLAGLILAGCSRIESPTEPRSEAAPVAGEAPWSSVPSVEAARRNADPWAAPRPSRATTFAGVPKRVEPFFSNAQLRRNFLAIAMQAEATDYDDTAGNIPIAKWVTPIRYSVAGATPRDRTRIAELSQRIRRLTGIDMAPARDRAANVRINFVPFRLRNRAFYALFEEGLLGRSTANMMTLWRDTERAKCIGIISFDPQSGAIVRASIYIKDELPRETRDACIVEEIVQSLGLMNDSPMARPSIFNDSQEYLDLTTHDEYLLRILYDRRIRPRMGIGEVYPLVNRIVEELRPGGRDAGTGL